MGKAILDFLKQSEKLLTENKDVQLKLKISIEIEIENNPENREYIFDSLLQLRKDTKELQGTMVTNTNEIEQLIISNKITIEYILKIVCDYLGVPIEMLQSDTRKLEIVQARQIAMYFSKNLTKLSLATIGSQIGDKDHATVLHACRRIEGFLDVGAKEINGNIKMQTIIDEIGKKIKL
jgi:chromosomal replication initiator protein